jgi:hypothetical protein
VTIVPKPEQIPGDTVSNSASAIPTEPPFGTGDRICPHLGRCDDPRSLYAFSTIENCCHATGRPFPIEPSYQERTCLGDDWPECPRFTGIPGEDKALNTVVVSSPWSVIQQFPLARELAGIVVVVAILVGVWFLVLRPQDTPQVEMTNTAGTAIAARIATSELGTVAAQAATQTPTQTPTVTASPTTTPSRTPTHTITPTATQTPTHTPSPSPTVTPSTTPSATPSLTPSLTPIPTTAVPTPTATPTVTSTPLPAPKLLSPEERQVFAASDEIVMSWQAVGALPEEGYYVVTASYTHLGDTWYDEIPWIQDTSWTFSDHDYLIDLSDDGRFFWSVQVMLRTGLDAEGKPIGIAISPSSDTWSLTWLRAGGTPTPPPP